MASSPERAIGVHLWPEAYAIARLRAVPESFPSLPADGVVTFADRDSGYGRLLKINHGYGYSTMYGHLDRFLVKEGTRVTRGQAIGKVGMSGRTTGPHLHYEVWKDGEKQNPLYYILDAY